MISAPTELFVKVAVAVSSDTARRVPTKLYYQSGYRYTLFVRSIFPKWVQRHAISKVIAKTTFSVGKSYYNKIPSYLLELGAASRCLFSAIEK